MNKRRKARKAEKIGNYHLHKKENFKKALDNYIRAIWYINSAQYLKEVIYHDIAYCYENLGDYANAEKYILECLRIAPGYLNWKKYLWELYKIIWKDKESVKLLAECKSEEEKIKNQELDLDAFYNSK